MYENFDRDAILNAMSAVDVVIMYLLGRLGYLKDGKSTVMVVDTLHKISETMEFLYKIEEDYGFNAKVFYS